MLPPLHEPTGVVGAVTPAAAAATGLATGTPVVAGYFDVVASALGSGAVGVGSGVDRRRQLVDQPGVLAEPVRDDRVFMVAACGEGQFANMENSATSAANLEWYVRDAGRARRPSRRPLRLRQRRGRRHRAGA